MGSILDRGSALFAILAAIGSAWLLEWALPFRLFGAILPVAALGLVYVPGVLVLGTLIGRLGGAGAAFRRDYSALLTCAAMAWTAAALPLAAAFWAAPTQAMLSADLLLLTEALGALAALYFAALMFFAVRTLFGIGGGASALIVGLSWIPLLAAAFLWPWLRYFLGYLTSPLLLLYAYYFLGSELRGLGDGFRGGQSYRRMLDAAALNPHDGDAQYQLGLIHQQRRQYAEAVRRFRAAVAIDPEAADAHFQLGRIARAQGRLEEAAAEFETVLRLDEKLSLGEAHRELGAAYLALGRLPEARRELTLFTERREYDSEGLCLLGQVLEQSGDAKGARDLYARAVEAARSAPRYRRAETARWSRLAQKRARGLRV